MGSDAEASPWKKVGVGALIAVGLFATVRLILMPFSPGAQTKPQTREEFHQAVQDIFAEERKSWEAACLESGKAPPPEGFDAAWKNAMGGGIAGAPPEQTGLTEATDALPDSTDTAP